MALSKVGPFLDQTMRTSSLESTRRSWRRRSPDGANDGTGDGRWSKVGPKAQGLPKCSQSG
jgi:hypothetical protein